MSTLEVLAARALPAFRNEPYVDFSERGNRAAADAALAHVRAHFGHDYDLLVAGRRVATDRKLRSLNPSHPAEVVGIHSKADAELAREAVEAAWKYFPQWAATPAATRVEMLVRTAEIIRQRKFEFDAWLVVEAGKDMARGRGRRFRGDRFLRVLRARR